MQNQMNNSKESGGRQEARDASATLSKAAVAPSHQRGPAQGSGTPNLERGMKQLHSNTKRNADLSPTSSHCVANEQANLAFDLDRQNLTQPARNLYKAKNNNARNMDETLLCLPFKAMTSPSTRHARHSSLLAQFNDISEQFKDTSPPDIIPYQGNKYGQNAQTLPGKLMICNQNNIDQPNKKDGDSPSYNSPPNQYKDITKGDGSNCSYVSRFITSQRSGYMEQKFSNGLPSGHIPRGRKGNFHRQSHLESQLAKMNKSKTKMAGNAHQPLINKESAQVDEIILDLDRDYDVVGKADMKKDGDKPYAVEKSNGHIRCNSLGQTDQSEFIPTCSDKCNTPSILQIAKNETVTVERFPSQTPQKDKDFIEIQPHAQGRCLRLKITQPEDRNENGREENTKAEGPNQDSEANPAANYNQNGHLVNISADGNGQSAKAKKSGRPIYLQIKIVGKDIQVRRQNSESGEEDSVLDGEDDVSQPEECPVHSCGVSNLERSGKGKYNVLGKRAFSRCNQHTPVSMSKGPRSQNHFDALTHQTHCSSKHLHQSGGRNLSFSNLKDRRRYEKYGQFLDETVCTGFEESAGMHNQGRSHELDLSDIVLKSEYDQDQHEATASASFTEKTTTIQQEDDNMQTRINVKNHHYEKRMFTPRSSGKGNHSAAQPKMKLREQMFHPEPAKKCDCSLNHGSNFMEKLFRKHYLEMAEFRQFARHHLMYIDEYQHRYGRATPPHQHYNYPYVSGFQDADSQVQSWQNYQGNLFKRQRVLEPHRQASMPNHHQSAQMSEARTPGFNGVSATQLDRKFLPNVHVQPSFSDNSVQPAEGQNMMPPPLTLQKDIQKCGDKNTTEIDKKEMTPDNFENAPANEKEKLETQDAKARDQPPAMAMRNAFGEMTNDEMPPGPPISPHQNDMPELFFGVSKPFFSNTYKKREKKVGKKLASKQDKENRKDQKAADHDGKKDKPKARTQKNNIQKLALQDEFLKDPTWSNSQCKRISQQTGLSVAQVYKWGWDKKNRMTASKNGQCSDGMPGMMPMVMGDSGEYGVMAPSPHHQDFERMQSFDMHGLGF